MSSTMPTPPAGRGPGDRARLAHALRRARKGAGLSGTDAGKRANMSQSKVSKIERGFLLPSVEDVAALCRAYELGADERTELLALAAGLREEASARVILSRGVAEMQRRIGQLEATASLIRGFQPTMVLGLLQTAAYARLVFGIPDSQALSAGEVDEAVEARTARQRALDDSAKSFEFVLTEGALRWHAGSATVMAEQIDAIAEAAKRPNVRLGLIPWTTPVHVFPLHGFHLYDQDAAIVGTETATATMTGAADVAAYVELFTMLQRCAVLGDEATDHLDRIAEEYRRLPARTRT